MADIPRASFIPRESGMTPTRVRRTRVFHVFGFIATAVLVGSLLSAGGVYFLKRTAEKSFSEAQLALQKQKDLFKESDVAEVREFDRRLQAARLLIDNHISPLRVFEALERSTKQRIQFSGLTLEHTPGQDILLTLSGDSQEFKTLALQESALESDSLFSPVTFATIATQEDEATGRQSITFSIEGLISPSQIRYDGTSAAVGSPTSYMIVGDQIVAVEEGSGAVLGDAVVGSLTNE